MYGVEGCYDCTNRNSVGLPISRQTASKRLEEFQIDGYLGFMSLRRQLDTLFNQGVLTIFI